MSTSINAEVIATVEARLQYNLDRYYTNKNTMTENEIQGLREEVFVAEICLVALRK